MNSKTSRGDSLPLTNATNDGNNPPRVAAIVPTREQEQENNFDVEKGSRWAGNQTNEMQEEEEKEEIQEEEEKEDKEEKEEQPV